MSIPGGSDAADGDSGLMKTNRLTPSTSCSHCSKGMVLLIFGGNSDDMGTTPCGLGVCSHAPTPTPSQPWHEPRQGPQHCSESHASSVDLERLHPRRRGPMTPETVCVKGGEPCPVFLCSSLLRPPERAASPSY